MSVVRAAMLICVIFALVNSVSANNSTGVSITIKTLPLPSVSSGGSSSGSGGSGVVTSEDPKNINNFESKDGDLLAGQEVKYNFDKTGAGISYVVVTGKENENDVTIRVENLKGQSGKATTPAPNVVYLYTNILSGSQRIASARIGFKVPSAWIDNNNIGTTTVKMYRWQDNQWNALDTKLMGGDFNNYFYEATTTGFSSFAIVGQAIVVPTATPTVTPTQASTPATTISTVPVATPKTPGFSLVIGLISLILAIYQIRKGQRQ